MAAPNLDIMPSIRSVAAALLIVLGVVPMPVGAQAGPAGAVRSALEVAATVRGLTIGEQRAPTPSDLPSALARAEAAMGVTGDHADALAAFATLPRDTQAAMAALLDAVTIARDLRDAAFDAITDEEVAFAATVGARASAGVAGGAEAARAAAIVHRIDADAMLHAAALLHETAATARPSLRRAALATATCSPGNLLCVGTDGDDIWTEDVQILIDPAGDDTYLNNAGGTLYAPGFHGMGGCAFGGGTTGKARPNLDCTAAPPAACTYDVANRATGRDDLPVANVPGHDDPDGPDGGGLSDGSCGNEGRQQRMLDAIAGADEDADARGVAVLLDLDGSDRYTVPWSHHDPLFGLIEDCFPGEADRVNTNRDMFQGSALGGIALLWDDGAGDDVYRGRLNAQGSGHVGGVGLQIATGTGDATFWADRLSQGSGIAAGVGALVNTKTGSHTYLLDAPLVYRNEFAPNGRRCSQEGRAGQGQGGFGGVGILWTDGGEASYRAVTHATEDTHPFAPVLEDGAPLLVGGTDAQGSGESFPIVDTPGGLVAGAGMLFDRTDGDASVCPARADGGASSGMIAGSSTGTGIDLASIGLVAPCGTFNLPSELDPVGDLGSALLHLLGGAVGVRVVA